MARAVRPGGRVVLVDDDHDTLRLHPEAPTFMALWRAYCEQYSRRGMDPWVGRRLTGLLHGAGLEPVDSDMLFFGACAGMERFATVVSNLIGVVAGAREDIRRSAVLDEAGIRDGLEEARRWSAAPDAAMWYALPFAVGLRPG